MNVGIVFAIRFCERIYFERRIMKQICICVAALSLLASGCVSQLTVFSGGATAPGSCNKSECALGSLYGIDWSGKENGVNSCNPQKPMARVSTIVRPQDFAIAFFTLGMVIPLHLEYDLESNPLPRRNSK